MMKKIVLFTCLFCVSLMLRGQSDGMRASQFKNQGIEDSCMFYARKMMHSGPSFDKSLQFARWLADFGHCKQARTVMDSLARVEHSELQAVRLGLARVFLLFRMDKTRLALRALHELTERFPLNEEVLADAGFIYYALRDNERAVFYLEACLQLDDYLTEVLLYAGAARLALGHQEETAQWLEKLYSIESLREYPGFSSFVSVMMHPDLAGAEDPCSTQICLFRDLHHYAALPLLCGDKEKSREMLNVHWSSCSYEDYFYLTHSPEFDLVREEAWFRHFIARMKKGDLSRHSIPAEY